MVFSNFIRSESNNQILFRNFIPIQNVDNIKFYKDDSSGSFSKKEFRWSFNNNYWASWEILNQENVTNIEVKGNSELYIEIRYINSSSGNVYNFSIDYIESSNQSSKTKHFEENIKNIKNADLLNKEPGSFYLLRTHHKGEQPISSITNLQTSLLSRPTFIYVDGSLLSIDLSINYLYNHTGGVSQSYVDASLHERDLSINVLFNRPVSDASLRSYVDGSLAIRDNSLGNLSHWDVVQDNSIISIDLSINYLYTHGGGVQQSYVDGSLAIRDTSLGNLSNWQVVQDSSITNLRSYVDSSLVARDSSINYLYTHGGGVQQSYVDGSLATRDTSLGNLSNWQVIQDLSLNALRTYTDGSLATRDTSLGNLSNWQVIQDSSITNLRSYVDSSLVARDSSINYLYAPTSLGINIGASTLQGTLEVATNSTNTIRGIVSMQNNTGTNSAKFIGLKSRGTITSPTTLVTGDALTRWAGYGYDSSSYIESAAIDAMTIGTIAVNRMPSTIRFYTSTDASPSVLTLAGYFDQNQNLDLSSGLYIAGAGGKGFINFAPQSIVPGTPSTGYSLYANSAGKFEWVGTNGYYRTFDGTANTGSRVYVLPDRNVTFDNITSSTTCNSTGYLYGNGTAISFNPNLNLTLPSSDKTYNGTTVTMNVAQTTNFGDACYIGSAGTAVLGNASAIATSGTGMICVSASPVTVGNPAVFLINGILYMTGWTWTVGGIIYLSTTGTTGNTLSQSVIGATNNVSQPLGRAWSANVMYWDPTYAMVEYQ